MAWHRPGDNPLADPLMVSLLTHICVTQPRWVNIYIVELSMTLSCYKGGVSIMRIPIIKTKQSWDRLIHTFGNLNTLRPRQNGRHFADDTFKRIFMNENIEISIKISLKFVPKGSINSIQALVQKMAWRRLGDKPLSEPMLFSSLTHICVTWPQWVKVMRRYLAKSWIYDIWVDNHFVIVLKCDRRRLGAMDM